VFSMKHFVSARIVFMIWVRINAKLMQDSLVVQCICSAWLSMQYATYPTSGRKVQYAVHYACMMDSD
jgi:hypothetical protein